MQKLLVICGPTATGKTSLGIFLAEKFNGEIISADSRQVYRGMDVGTGKQFSESVRIWGYDFADPKESFSVSQYANAAAKAIKNIVSRGKLPILVGGTGLYIKSVLDGIETSQIPPNDTLRKSLNEKSSDELFDLLKSFDVKKAEQMNASDKANPRRLIRAIEIAQSGEKVGKKIDKYDCLMIGLSTDTEILKLNVEKNIKERSNKIVSEIEKLLDEGITWEDQSMSALGARQLRNYFEKKQTLAEATDQWIKEEQKYLKRQLTWFKKDSRIHWFDINNENFLRKVEDLVEKWDNVLDA